MVYSTKYTQKEVMHKNGVLLCIVRAELDYIAFKRSDSMYRIEKLNENQIKCTLSKQDLDGKGIKLSELAYGTDKARALFRELMLQAETEVGFEADDVPLMIEAIPLSGENLVLIITKVDDPDELDTRFSRFTGTPVEDDDFDIDTDSVSEDEGGELTGMGITPEAKKTVAEGIIEALKHLESTLSAGKGHESGNVIKAGSAQSKEAKAKALDAFRIYAFKTLDQVIVISRLVGDVYRSDNTLYKNPADKRFYLYMTNNNNTDAEFNQTCNVIGEYGVRQRSTYASRAHMDEYFKIIVHGNAIQTLSKL